MLDRIHEGHRGITKYRQRTKSFIWWPGLKVVNWKIWSNLAANVPNTESNDQNRWSRLRSQTAPLAGIRNGPIHLERSHLPLGGWLQVMLCGNINTTVFTDIQWTHPILEVDSFAPICLSRPCSNPQILKQVNQQRGMQVPFRCELNTEYADSCSVLNITLNITHKSYIRNRRYIFRNRGMSKKNTVSPYRNCRQRYRRYKLCRPSDENPIKAGCEPKDTELGTSRKESCQDQHVEQAGLDCGCILSPACTITCWWSCKVMHFTSALQEKRGLHIGNLSLFDPEKLQGKVAKSPRVQLNNQKTPWANSWMHCWNSNENNFEILSI